MYNRQLGGQPVIFRGPMYQRGYGLGGYFKRFFNWIIPLAERHIVPQLKSGAKEIGKELVNATSNVAKEVIEGKNIKGSAEEHFENAFVSIKTSTEKKLKGSGIKRSIKGKIFYIKNKKTKKDIFN
jgi:hypothetical protein